MEVTIAGRTFNLERLLTPAGRRAALADPENARLIREIQARPEQFGLDADDARAIIEWSTGEFDGATAQELRETFAPAEENMNDKQMTELQNLYASREYRRASEIRRTNSAKLNDPANRAERLAWNRAQELEAALKAAEPKREDRDYAGNPKSPGGVLKPTNRYVSTMVSDLAKLPPVEQANKARELRARIRDDKAHPYWNEHHEGHKQAVEEMALLYKAEQLTDGSPTLGEE